MDPEFRWNALLESAKAVHSAITNGHHPTFDQLWLLEGAIQMVEAQRVCGCRFIDGPCDCEELNRCSKAVHLKGGGIGPGDGK